MSKNEVKKYLKGLDHESLQKMILDLYSISKEAKDYLEYSINPNDHAKYVEIRDLIDREFVETYRYRRLKFTKCKNAISYFKKLDPVPEMIAELMVYMVEKATRTASIWGNAEPSFIDSLASNYNSAGRFLVANNLQEKYSKRMDMLYHEIDNFGYGAYMLMSDVHNQMLTPKCDEPK